MKKTLPPAHAARRADPRALRGPDLRRPGDGPPACSASPSRTAVALDRIRAGGAAPRAAADVSPLLDELRWVKTPYEIERLRRSGTMGAEATAEAIRATRPGMYEYEIAAAAQYVSTRLGAHGDAFPPIVPSGPLTPIVHYMENRRQMQAGEIVYMDYGSDWEYYTSDITRTWPVSGQLHRRAGEDVPLRAGGAERDHRRHEAGGHAQPASRTPRSRCTSATATGTSSSAPGGTSATSWGSRCTTWAGSRARGRRSRSPVGRGLQRGADPPVPRAEDPPPAGGHRSCSRRRARRT